MAAIVKQASQSVHYFKTFMGYAHSRKHRRWTTEHYTDHKTSEYTHREKILYILDKRSSSGTLNITTLFIFCIVEFLVARDWHWFHYRHHDLTVAIYIFSNTALFITTTF